MKKKIHFSIFFLLSFLALFQFTNAQVPDAIRFQAVARDANGNIVSGQTIGIKIAVKEGSSSGNTVYVETHTPTTNSVGFFGISIGTSNTTQGNFSTIDWSANDYYLMIGLDPTNSGNYPDSSTTQLISVPYALHARTSERALNDADTLSNNELVTSFYSSGDSLVLIDGGGTYVVDLSYLSDGDADSLNELQSITISAMGTMRQLVIDDARGNPFDTVSFDVGDSDNDSTNELNTAAFLVNDTLVIIDAGGAITVDLGNLSSFLEDDDQDSTNELQHLLSNRIPNSNDWAIDIADGQGTVINVADSDSSTTNELISSFNFLNDSLSITDAGGTHYVNMTSLSDADQDTTNELQSLGLTINSQDRTIIISDGNGVPLDSLTFSVADNDNDPLNELQTISQNGSSITLSNGGGTITVVDNDSDSTNELQAIWISNDTVFLSNSGFAVLPPGPIDTDDQTLSVSGNTLTISDGNFVTLNVNDADADPNNEIQHLTMLGSSLGLTNSPFSYTVDSDPSNEWITQAALSGNLLQIFEGPNSQNVTTVDLGPLVNGGGNVGCNQLLTINGTNLNISDQCSTLSVNLASLIDDADADPTNELITSVTLNGSDLTISQGNNVKIVNLNSLLNDADANPLNELQVISFDSITQMLTLSNGGGTVQLNMGGSGGDNLGNHTATTNIQLGNHFLSGDGDPEGVRVDQYGNTLIGPLNNSNNTSGGSCAIGRNNDASGQYSISIGESNTASNLSSIAMGYSSEALGRRSIAIGHYAKTTGSSFDGSLALGFANGNGITETEAGPYSLAIGKNIRASASSSANANIAIGSGFTNQTGSSLMLGMEATTPSITCLSGSGATPGRVGIGTINPQGGAIHIHNPDDKGDIALFTNGQSGSTSSGFVIKYSTFSGSSTTPTNNNVNNVTLENKKDGGILLMENGREVVRARSWVNPYPTTGAFTPASQGLQNLGVPNWRWHTVYTKYINATNTVFCSNLVTTSDRNLKKEISDLHYGLDEINSLRPVTYYWKDDNGDSEKLEIGLIAQELEEIIPEVVSKGDSEESFMGVYYLQLTPVLIKAIQEQQDLIKGLESRIEFLEKK